MTTQTLFPFLDIDYRLKYVDIGKFRSLSGIVDNDTNLEVSHMESIRLAYRALMRQTDQDLKIASYSGKISEDLQRRVLALLLLSKWLYSGSNGGENV